MQFLFVYLVSMTDAEGNKRLVNEIEMKADIARDPDDRDEIAINDLYAIDINIRGRDAWFKLDPESLGYDTVMEWLLKNMTRQIAEAWQEGGNVPRSSGVHPHSTYIGRPS